MHVVIVELTMKYHVFPTSAAKYKEGEIHPATLLQLFIVHYVDTTALLPGDAEFKAMLSESEIRRLLTLDVSMLLNRADISSRDTGRAGSLAFSCTCCSQLQEPT